ncbi:Uma2 family endonuclease [Streptacidiphilus sp. 4-A2]|nr:Uma2 family endonuclease [Streptacidiphilus sp. 4-A2]
MSADPVTEPMPCDPIDLLIALEEAAGYPIRPEYIEGTVIIPPQPDDNHSHGIMELIFQFRVAGVVLAGTGNGYTTESAPPDDRALVIPDFYVRYRRATELDEAFRKTNKGWYPISMLALVGEVTSSNRETDIGPKYRTYAAAAVPVYVIVDRRDRMVHVYSEPDPDARSYLVHLSVPLGGKLPLPAPYPVLDTAPLVED